MKEEKNNLDLLQKLLKKYKFLSISKYILWFMDNILLFFLIKKPKKASEKKQVAILASFGVGDGIVFLNTAKRYRELYPKDKYETTVICSSKIKMLFEEETEFDNILQINIDEGFTNIRKRIDIYKKINKKYYDIFIDVFGPSYCSMNVYATHMAFAKEKIALINKKECLCPKKIVNKTYNKKFYIDRSLHIAEYFNELVNCLSNKREKVDFKKTKNYKLEIEIPEKYFIVFPSASSENKKWDKANYAKIIKMVYQKTNLPVLFSGTEKDEIAIQNVIKLMGDIPYYNITSKTTLMEFFELIKRAQFCITNDSGSYHIAVIEETPVAIIAGGYHYDKYINYNFETKYNFKKPYVITKNKKCFNCLGQCSIGDKEKLIWPCLSEIDIEFAWNIIEKMIDENYVGEVKK